MPPPRAACLSASNDVYRVGSVVYRPVTPWTPTVHALLRHLHAHGFAGAQQPLGSGLDPAGRQVLTFVEGEQVHPGVWSDDGIAGVGRLLRGFHDASATFEPPADAIWMPWYMHRPGGDPVIGHGDVGPWNIVARGGVPVAFIDWECAGPLDRLDEVAEAARLNCQLHGDEVARLNDLPSAEERARQLGIFADAYGLTSPERAGLVRRMIEGAVRGCANDTDEAGITRSFLGPHPMVWGMAWQVRGAVWILDHRTLLNRALSIP